MLFDPYADSPIKRGDTDASRLNREQAATLMGWCDCQSESLWDGMTLQEILHVYHVSIEHLTFEDWAEECGDVARHAWNAVTKPENWLVLGDD